MIFAREGVLMMNAELQKSFLSLVLLGVGHVAHGLPADVDWIK